MGNKTKTKRISPTYKDRGIVAHVTIVARRGSQRGLGTGSRYNVCGAELTAYDMSVAEAKGEKLAGMLEEWLTCPACRALEK